MSPNPLRRAWMLQNLLALGWGLGPGRGLASVTNDDTPRPGRALQFPRDFGAHPGNQIEWWYVTGALRPVQGGDALFGFQITFFRSRTALADRPQVAPSRLAPRHLLFAHAALTDVNAGKLLHAERLARWGGPEGVDRAPGPESTPYSALNSLPNTATGPAPRPAPRAANASVTDTAVHIGRWHLQRSGPTNASRYEGSWHDDDAGFGLNLNLHATQPVLLQGEAGYSRKSPRPGHASGYYSQPQLRARGVLHHQGRRMEVQGTAWLDHEWSRALLDPDAVGWDWLGLNLDDGTALTVFRLRRADGSALWAGGSMRRPGQAVRSFQPQEVTMQPGRTWRSPATDAVYPVEWTITTPAGTHGVQALVDAQELDNRMRTGTVYWEGLSSLMDAQGRRVGLGYLEMTGYAGRLQL